VPDVLSAASQPLLLSTGDNQGTFRHLTGRYGLVGGQPRAGPSFPAVSVRIWT